MTTARGGGPLRFATFLAPNMLPVYRFLADRIGDRLGRPVELVVGSSFDEFELGQADLGVICGLPYVWLADRLVMAFMLFHLPRPIAGLAEAWRVLRPGGRIGLLTWGKERESRARSQWVEELDAEGATEFAEKLSWHELVNTLQKVNRELQAAGFTVAVSRVESFVERPTCAEFVSRRTSLGWCGHRWESLQQERRLIAGPGVLICERCVVLAQDLLRPASSPGHQTRRGSATTASRSATRSCPKRLASNRALTLTSPQPSRLH